MHPKDRDTLLRFMFEDAPIRGELVRLDASWLAILERHDYPAPVRNLLGEMMAACALLVATIKFEGTLSLQIQGNGPISLAVMEASSERTLRGLALWDGEIAEDHLDQLIGDGTLAITIIQRESGNRYQGIVELVGDNLAQSLENYLMQSEQLETRLWLAADAGQACGMLLQKMPAADLELVGDTWNRTCHLGNTLKRGELLLLPGREIIHRLFHEEDIRLLGSEHVAFRCSCSRERVATMLRGLGKEEVNQIIDEQGAAEIACEYCNHLYRFDAIDAVQLFVETALPLGSKAAH